MTLADDFGYDEKKLKEQLDFLEITPKDCAHVRALADSFASFREYFT